MAGQLDQHRIFDVVNEEAGRLLGAQTCNLVRFESESSLFVMAGWSEPGVANVPPNQRLPLDGPTSTYQVHRTRRPARVVLDGVPGELADRLRETGFTSSVAAPIFVEGQLWGAVAASSVNAEPLPADAEERLGGFAELVGQAIANAEAREALAASRARLVEAADAARRAIERDLHDGAQQRLVALGMRLRVARASVRASSPDAEGLLTAAIDELNEAATELRELARGINPAVLTDHGLSLALAGLAKRSPLKVDLVAVPAGRLAASAEAAAYFVVAEALTNSARYAAPCTVRVEVKKDNGRLTVAVADTGPGGAVVRPGSGLQGLADRVGAVRGAMTLDSPVGVGTTVRAELPCS